MTVPLLLSVIPGNGGTLVQVVGLIVTSIASIVVAYFANRGASRADRVANRLTGSMPNGGQPGNGVAASWRTLAQEWEERYRECEQHRRECRARRERLEVEIERLKAEREQPGA